MDRNILVKFVAEQLVYALEISGVIEESQKMAENPTRWHDYYGIRWGGFADDRVHQRTGIVFSEHLRREIRNNANFIDDEVFRLVKESKIRD